MLNKGKNNDGMKKISVSSHTFKNNLRKNTLNVEFDVSYKKPLTRVTVILLTHLTVGLKTKLSLTV